MNKTLVEGVYGHGASIKWHNILKIKTKRFFRNIQGRKIARSEIPFDWTKPIVAPNLPIKNQYQSSSCGGQLASYLEKILRLKYGIDTDPQTGELSAKSYYAPIAYPGGGTTLSDLEVQLGTIGGNLESEVPSQMPSGGCTEQFMTDLSWQTPTIKQDALTRAGWTPYSIEINKEAIAEAIRDYGGVGMLIRGQNGNQPNNWLTIMPSPPITSNPDPLWGHFMASGGTTTTAIDFFQSWGLDVGNKGHQYFDDSYFLSGYILDVFTMIPDNRIVSLPVNMGWWQYFVNLFNSLIKK